MKRDEYQNEAWFEFLEEDLQSLLITSSILMEKASSWDEKLIDYSFVVFPAAKAYEGYLKKIFYERGFISKDDYYGKRFRIGKALNPSLDPRFKNESVYRKIAISPEKKELADKLWETWKLCRNILFHWFPDEKNTVTLNEAGERVARIIDTMSNCFAGCNIKYDQSK